MKQMPRHIYGVFLLFGLGGCAGNAFILSSTSNISNEDAVSNAQQSISNAQESGCHIVGFASGAGSGFVIADDCGDCDELNDKAQIYTINVLARCPAGKAISQSGEIVE